MTPDSKQCDWCNQDIDEDTFKLYNGFRLHMDCYKEYVEMREVNNEEE
jgi:hypothetical protein